MRVVQALSNKEEICYDSWCSFGGSGTETTLKPTGCGPSQLPQHMKETLNHNQPTREGLQLIILPHLTKIISHFYDNKFLSRDKLSPMLKGEESSHLDITKDLSAWFEWVLHCNFSAPPASLQCKMRQIPEAEGFAISNSTVPVSRSRILNLVKSILYMLSSGLHK